MTVLVVAVVVLLLIQVYLLGSAVKLLKLMSDILGCNAGRTERIRRLMKTLGYEDFNRSPKLDKAEHKKLDEELVRLFESEKRSGPAKAWQLIELNERVDALAGVLESKLTPRN